MAEEMQIEVDNVHGAVASVDGAGVLLRMVDAAGNIVGVSMPADTATVVIAALMSANLAAAKISGKRSAQHIIAGDLTVSDPCGKGNQHRLLRVYIHREAPPVLFEVERARLLRLAKGLIEMETGSGPAPHHTN